MRFLYKFDDAYFLQKVRMESDSANDGTVLEGESGAGVRLSSSAFFASCIGPM